MNKWHGVGNITRDPEYRTLPSGVTCCQFTVACQRRFKNANGTYDADFINCVAWRSTADFVHRYFIKGNKIGVTGSIQTRSYDAQDGSKRYVTTVVADRVEIEHKAERKDEQPEAPQGGQEFTEVDEGDELPF